MTMQAENQPQAARQSAVREMSDEELRVKVAELGGWRPQPEVQDPKSLWDDVAIAKMMNDPSRLPNYPADLNAMAEADKVLDQEQRAQFGLLLFRSCNCYWQRAVSATARQRAEAFVLTLAPSLPAAVQPPNDLGDK